MGPIIRLLLVAAALLAPPATGQGPPVAAASDLKFALAEIAEAFRRDSGQTLRIVYGSSGSLAQQIEHGAPFELFLSADERAVERLAARGVTRDSGVVYAIGRIALLVPAGSPLAADATLADLRAALDDGRLKRFAIANPEHAPYGRAAREALLRLGLWPAMQRVLVMGENAAQATQFAVAGAAQGGIVPAALARAPEIASRGASSVLSDALHEPLRQRMVALNNAGAVAMRFYEYLQSGAARAILARHGFTLPPPR